MAGRFPLILFVTLLGCAATGPSDPVVRPLTRIDPKWVSGDAALRLQADGRFNLSNLVTPEAGESGEQAAQSLATAVVHSLANSVGGLREFVEQRHGAQLDFVALIACTRTLWQRSPWILPTDEGPLHLRNAIGSRFWFSFCTPSGERAMFQQVAAQTAATIATDGHINFPGGSGNDFASYGIPLDGGWELSPEVAVEALIHAVPRKVAIVGEFTGCPFSIPPCAGGDGYVWHLYVDRPIRIRRKNDMVELDVVDFYVEASRTSNAPLRILIPDRLQPPDQWLSGPGINGPDSVWVVRRGPVRFSSIDVIGK